MKEKENLFVPISIIIAGIIVAGAVFLTNKNDVEIDSVKNAPTAENAIQADPSSVKPVDDKDYIRGNLDAKVKIIEFSDTECPFCKIAHKNMIEVVKQYDSSEVAWVYRHFPLTQLHSKAITEANATECAAEQGGNDKFWLFIDKIYEITPSNDGLNLTKLPEIAQELGLNVEEFNACMDSEKHNDKIEEDFNDAVKSGGRGTPYFVVVTKDGEFSSFSGALPVEKLKSQIDALLN